MGLFGIIIVLFCLGMLIMFFGLSQIRKFLEMHGRISSRMDMTRFKSMVRMQMYLALVQMVVLGSMSILSIVGILTDRLSFGQFIGVLVLDGVIWLAGTLGKSTERKAQNLEVDDPELKTEYGSVCRTWTAKPFPDF